MSKHTKPIKRVVIYIKSDIDNWGENVVALADIQINFPEGNLSLIKCLSIISIDNEIGLVIPLVKMGMVSVPILRGNELITILEDAVLNMYNTIKTNAEAGSVWERCRYEEGLYTGLAKKEYCNAQYRTVIN
jgi:hypothetical protein